LTVVLKLLAEHLMSGKPLPPCTSSSIVGLKWKRPCPRYSNRPKAQPVGLASILGKKILLRF